MFDRHSDGFNGVSRKPSGHGTISEKTITDAMKEVRTASLEADVHFDDDAAEDLNGLVRP